MASDRMFLELSDQERDKLVGILDKYSTDLRIEVRKTNNPEFKSRLRLEKIMVQQIRNRMRQVPEQ
jgi:hypothetical protein